MAVEALVILLLIVAGVGVAVMIAGVLAFELLRGTVRLLTGACAVRPRVARRGIAGTCWREGCGVVNPPEARFCRRCGRALASHPPAAAALRRAAVW